MTTTFQKNVTLNLAFGNAKGDVTSPNFGKIRNQAKLVLEETRELLEAAYFDHDVVLELKLTPKAEPAIVDVKDIMREIMDAQGDITTVNDGVAHIAGFDGDECLQRVYASNMSKFVRSEDEVGPALDYYYSRGFPDGQLRIEGQFPQACIKVNETVEWNGKEYPAGKFLKNMATFKEPDFTDMLSAEPTRQVTEIIVTSTATPGQINMVKAMGVAYVPVDFIQFIAPLASVGYEALYDGNLESFIPVFEFNKDNMESAPELWGHWKANVRMYPASPVQQSTTGLTRID